MINCPAPRKPPGKVSAFFFKTTNAAFSPRILVSANYYSSSVLPQIEYALSLLDAIEKNFLQRQVVIGIKTFPVAN